MKLEPVQLELCSWVLQLMGPEPMQEELDCHQWDLHVVQDPIHVLHAHLHPLFHRQRMSELSSI